MKIVSSEFFQLTGKIVDRTDNFLQDFVTFIFEIYNIHSNRHERKN